MNKNVYVRSKRSIMSISLTRIIMILPLIIYGFYKNGIYLYRNNLVNTITMFKPLIIILGSILIAIIVNVLYEILIKKNKDTNIKNLLFSSFHIEYAILIASIMSINVNLLVYFIALTVIMIASKFIGDKVNTICLTFLIIYVISQFLDGFTFLNIYESSKTFSYEFLDYLIGRAPGGIASTHILLIVLALFGLCITNNNKTTITLTSIVTYLVLMFIYCFLSKTNFAYIIFSNNFLFLVGFVATDSVTSCYTNKGMLFSGILIALISFGIYFINPILAPIIAILIVSITAHFMDEFIYVLSQKKGTKPQLNI